MSLAHKLDNIKLLNQSPGQEYWLRQCLRDCIDETNAVVHHLHRSYIIVRIRVCPKGKPFTSVCDLSYPPVGVSGEGRANPEGRSLFYGSSCERRKILPKAKWEHVTDRVYGLSIALYETLFELRKNAYTSSQPQLGGENEEKVFFISDCINLDETAISYGFWQAKETINLIKSAPFSMYDYDTFDQFQNRTILLRKYNPDLPLLDGPPFKLEFGGCGRPVGLTGTECRTVQQGVARWFPVPAVDSQANYAV